MGAPETILAGLVAMFSAHLIDIDAPRVQWYNPSALSGEWKLGQTDCGYSRNKKTGESKPYCRIKLNECLLGNPKELIDTYLHELAHHVDWVSDEEWDNHGGQWRSLTKTWDLVSHKATVGQVDGCNIPE